MQSKNIIFQKFGKKIQNKSKIKKILNFYSNKKLIKSFSNKYSYSFRKSEISKYKHFKHYTIIGMGGSSLGTEAIYNFLKFKIKKNLYLKII